MLSLHPSEAKEKVFKDLRSNETLDIIAHSSNQMSKSLGNPVLKANPTSPDVNRNCKGSYNALPLGSSLASRSDEGNKKQ